MDDKPEPLYVKLEEYAKKMSASHKAVTESLTEHSAAAAADRDASALARYNQVKEMAAAKQHASSGGA